MFKAGAFVTEGAHRRDHREPCTAAQTETGLEQSRTFEPTPRQSPFALLTPSNYVRFSSAEQIRGGCGPGTRVPWPAPSSTWPAARSWT